MYCGHQNQSLVKSVQLEIRRMEAFGTSPVRIHMLKMRYLGLNMVVESLAAQVLFVSRMIHAASGICTGLARPKSCSIL